MLACLDGKQTRSEAIKNYHLRILIRTTKLLRHWIRRASMVGILVSGWMVGWLYLLGVLAVAVSVLLPGKTNIDSIP